MAEIEDMLIFTESALDKDGTLYASYQTLLTGLGTLASIDAPDLTSNPPTKSDGSIDLDTISAELTKYQTAQRMNAAYVFASVIDSGGGGGSVSTKYLQKAGDSMSGVLNALYGFAAGAKGQKVFEVTVSDEGGKSAILSGSLTLSGDLNISESGISYAGNKVVWSTADTLTLQQTNIALKGKVEIDGSFKAGNVLIDGNTFIYNNNEIYHAGNSNNSTTDWTMKNANVYGDLIVEGKVDLKGATSALYGFAFGEQGTALCYTEIMTYTDSMSGATVNEGVIKFNTDVRVNSPYGIKFSDRYVLVHYNANDLSFSAPSGYIRLGDAEIGTGAQTLKILLHSDLYNETGLDDKCVITKEGFVNAVNGIRAYSSNSGFEVLASYESDGHYGVLFPKELRFENKNGSYFYGDTGKVYLALAYFDDDNARSEVSGFVHSVPVSMYKYVAQGSGLAFEFDGEMEYFTFNKPVEGKYFTVKSTKYETSLLENELYFGEARFVEGVTGGMRWVGDGYFTGNLSTPSFASGFAGYGWAIKSESEGWHATFDCLTVRKKMRVYEFEVQKISATNGSLWVSDSCSGDSVTAL